MTDELLDYVDENDNVLGQIWRSKIDATNHVRRMVAVVVFNSLGQIMVCRNAKTKPGKKKWKFSVSGHVSSNESIDVAAMRETYEEIGVEIKIQNLFKIGVVKLLDDEEERKKIQHVFKIVHDGPFVIDEKESAECRFLSPDEINEIICDNPKFFTRTFRKFWDEHKNKL